uniref:HEAT repeat-containing PBS lyase n=1 Tax=Thermosporothrix sp. COM3 TaxID=2490863 RepID=A0A455ST73_9CHLR|nr:hypothetical protein KTC_30850 [Thermosporothrix sp. COM3]
MSGQYSQFNQQQTTLKTHSSGLKAKQIRVALVQLLAPDTDYHTRLLASRRLARYGPDALPLILQTLSAHEEITEPEWPWWPPQYEHCSRLLLHLSQKAALPLEALLQHPAIEHPPGPVLWISVIEAAELQGEPRYESLFREGLNTPWTTVRYAAALALVTRARNVTLDRATIQALYTHQHPEEAFPVRLTTAYALLNSREYAGLGTLLQLLHPHTPPEVRKAALFLLATEMPLNLSINQREQLATSLMQSLYDTDMELALQAAHALSIISPPSVLPPLSEMLRSPRPRLQLVALTALEEITRKDTMRRMIRSYSLPTEIQRLLKSPVDEVRRQAAYTLAACGGEYVKAVFGTIMLHPEHPAYVEAIEGMRLLHGALRASNRRHIVRWLLGPLQQHDEHIQVTALDSLAYLLYLARNQGKKKALQDISQLITQDPVILELLNDPSAWVRQRTLELLGMLWNPHAMFITPHAQILRLLLNDPDSGVRACAAFVCGHIGARWAIPALIQALLDHDEHVAQTAFHSLCQLTSTDDPLFNAVVHELSYLGPSESGEPHSLMVAAQEHLKQTQRARKRP